MATTSHHKNIHQSPVNLVDLNYSTTTSILGGWVNLDQLNLPSGTELNNIREYCRTTKSPKSSEVSPLRNLNAVAYLTYPAYYITTSHLTHTLPTYITTSNITYPAQYITTSNITYPANYIYQHITPEISCLLYYHILSDTYHTNYITTSRLTHIMPTVSQHDTDPKHTIPTISQYIGIHFQ